MHVVCRRVHRKFCRVVLLVDHDIGMVQCDPAALYIYISPSVVGT